MSTDCERLRVAFADPTRTVHVLTPSNGSRGQCSLSEVRDHMPVSCWPKDGLLVLDLDKPEHLARAQRWEKVSRTPYEIVKWKTGGSDPKRRGGMFDRQHWIIVIPECFTTQAVRMSCLAAGIPKLQIRYNQPSRPPLSAHRLGKAPSLLHPSNVDTAVAWLTGPRGKSLALPSMPNDEPLHSPNPRRDLPERAWRIAENGKEAGPYDKGTQARYALARYMAEAGWEFEEFLAVILDPAFRVGDSEVGRDRHPISGDVVLARRTDSDVAGRMLRTWNSAVLECGGGLGRRPSGDPLEHAYEVAQWRDRALAYPFGNERTKDSDRQVIETLANQLAQHHSWTVFPGARNLAAEANLKPHTAQASLHRFASSGALSIQQADQTVRTVTAARLHINKDWLGSAEGLPASHRLDGWTPDLQDPQVWLPTHSHIWDGHGLGVAALRVYCELTQGWLTLPELMEKTRLSRTSTEKGLKTLDRLGRDLGQSLIEHHGLSKIQGTWIALPLSDPASVEAAILNRPTFQSGKSIADRMQDLDLRHQIEREVTQSAREQARNRRLLPRQAGGQPGFS